MTSELSGIDQDGDRFRQSTQTGSQCKMCVLLTYDNFP